MALECFCMLSGLKINKSKCSLVGINTRPGRVERLAGELGCEVGAWPLKYLGLPLGGNPKTISFWNPVVEKVEKRLEGWKKAFLSRGGKLTLIQAVLESLPTYYLSLFKIPVGVAKRIEMLMRNFLWNGIGERKKDHMIRWEIVSKSKEKGGLGIGNLLARNKSLLGKWLWRFPLESTSLWHAVIRSKYGYDENGWDTKLALKGSCRSPWKDISSGLYQLSLCHRLEVGNGNKVRFWEDPWVEDLPLKTAFPRLFRLSRFHNSTVGSIAGPISFPISWDFGFRRNLNDAEFLELLSLLEKLGRVKLEAFKPDRRRWMLEPDGNFSSKSFHNFLTSEDSDPAFAPAKSLWSAKCPPKVKLLGWLLAHGRVNTCDNLQRRRPHSCFSPHWCVLCKAKGESVDHVFVECELSVSLWKKLFWEANVTWPNLLTKNQLLGEYPNAFGKGKKAKILWGCGVLAVIWVVWMERNNRIFEDYGGVGLEELWVRVKFWASLWASISKEFKDYTLSTIILSWQAAVV